MICANMIAFGKATGPVEYWGLKFTAEEDGSIVAMEAVGSAPAVNLETSLDGEIWEPFYVGETSITLNKDEYVYFRAGEGGNTAFAASGTAYTKFSLNTGKIAASGNIMSLLNGDVASNTIPAAYCYVGIFYGCTSLTQAPALPATTLADGCYVAMFRDCTSLTTAPALPVETLAVNCYRTMFYGCTSLTQAPELPATTLADGCYFAMFYGCTKLTSISVNFSAWNPTGATTIWFYNVTSSGTFTCPAELPETYGASYIPTNWTVVRK